MKIEIYLIIILSGLATACSSDAISKVNLVASAERVSYTDELSRFQARDSQQQLARRYKNYHLGPGDILEARVFELETAGKATTLEVRITKDGIISLPVIGIVEAANKTVDEVKKEIELWLIGNGILIEPRVHIQVKEFHSKKINIIGAVRRPGVYALQENVTTLLDILGKAEGVNDQAGYVAYVIKKENRSDLPTDNGKRDSKKVVKKALAQTSLSKKIPIDMYELIEQGNLELNMVLESGDIVFVPNAEEFAVTGFVNKAGKFPLHKPTTILEAIALAGGVKENGSPQYCLLKRQNKNDEELIPIDLVAIAERRQSNLYLQVNDVLLIRQTTAKYLYNQFSKFFRFALGYSIAGVF